MLKREERSFLSLYLIVTAMLIGQLRVTEAAQCSATELRPCASAINSGQAPSAACCSKLKQQTGCLCGYARDPRVAHYVNSPNARKVASSCGVSVPSC
nr:non-specific lipid-transfer protein 2-like [Ipomoea batatas]